MNSANSNQEPPASPSPRPGEVERSSARTRSWAGTLFKGIVNLVAILLLVYLTYFFTLFFATRRPGPPPRTESEEAVAKKAEELRAQDRKVLSSYGWVNPATKSVRIPVERAMELIAAESAQPVVTAANIAATPGPSPVAKAGAPQGVPVVTGAATAPATPGPSPVAKAGAPQGVPVVAGAAAAPATAAPSGTPPATVASVAAPPAPARVGMPPERIYFMVCLACHEADGRGTIARKTMKDAEQIPDLTDPKWQASRTDADLEHSILEGKGKIMLARKDILALAHTDVKEMVALMRGFRGGKQVITGVPTGQPLPAQPVLTAAGAQPPAPVSPALTQPTAPGPNRSTSTAPSPVLVAPLPPQTTMALASPAPGPTALPAASTRPPQPPMGPGLSAPATASPGPGTAIAQPPQSTAGPANSSPLALGTPTALSPERAARLQVASEFYRSNCFTCHGLDGTGNLVRPLMPAIPDFTSRQWQTSRSNTQLQTSIVEGKGTQMPPWTGKISPELARDLAAYVRTIGAPDLLALGSTDSTSTTELDLELRQLKAQWDDVAKQLRDLDLAAVKP